MLYGQTIGGRYRLCELIGKGGQAEVWRAQQVGLAGFTKDVVLKLVQLATHNAEETQALLQEASLAALLHHPNLVYVFDVGRHEDLLFLVMEYCEGYNLAELLALSQKHLGEPLPWDLASLVAMEICKGLHYAHTRMDESGKPLRLIHRDLKPSNILVGTQGWVKIIDFGLAKSTTTHTTQTGKLKGTPMYMSPEQITIQPLGPASDLFALGSLLHELCSGQAVFGRGDVYATLYAVLEDQVPALGEICPGQGIPDALEALLQSLLSKESAQRPASARVVQQSLGELLRTNAADCDVDDLANFVQDLMEQEAATQAQEKGAGSAGAARGVVPGMATGAFVSSLVQLKPSVKEDALQSVSTGDVQRGRWWLWVGWPAFLVCGLLLGFVMQRGGSGGLVRPGSPGAVPAAKSPIARPADASAPIDKARPQALRQQAVVALSPTSRRVEPAPKRVVSRRGAVPPPRPKRGVALARRGPLVRQKVRLRLSFSPACHLYLKQRHLGLVATKTLWVWPGALSFRCRRQERLFELRRTIVVPPKKAMSVRYKVDFGQLYIQASPWGMIWLKGFGEIGKTGKWLTLPVDVHVLRVHPEGRDDFQSLQVKIRKASRIRRVLPWKSPG